MTDTANPITRHQSSSQVLIGSNPLTARAFEAASGNVHVRLDGIGLSVVCDSVTVLRRLSNALGQIAHDLDNDDSIKADELGNRHTSVVVGEPLILGAVE